MPFQWRLTVTVNQEDGKEHEMYLGEITLGELPHILARIGGEKDPLIPVSSLVVILVKA